MLNSCFEVLSDEFEDAEENETTIMEEEARMFDDQSIRIKDLDENEEGTSRPHEGSKVSHGNWR